MLKKLYNKSAVQLVNEADILYQQNSFAESLEILDELDGRLISHPDMQVEMKSTNLKGLIHFKQGQYTKAEEYFLRSLDISEKIGEARYIYNRYDNLATLYINMKRYQLGVDYYQKAIALKESVGNYEDIARGYIQIASLHLAIDNTAAGKEALDKAYTLIGTYQLRELLMHWHYAMGQRYKREDDHKRALSEYTMAIQYGEEFNEPSLIRRAYSNQGDILMQQGRLAESEKAYLVTLQIAQDLNIRGVELGVSIQLAAISMAQGDIPKSRRIYESVSQKSADLEENSLQKDLAELSARINKAEGNYKAALEAQEKYLDYYKKDYDNELSRTVLDMQAKYEYERNEKELQKVKLRQIESELKTLKAERALETSEKRFRALIENGSDIIYIIDERLRPIYASPAAFHALGYDENDPVIKDIRQLLHPDDLPILLEKISLVAQNPGIPIFGQLRLPKKDGSYIWVEGTATNLYHVDGANGIVCNLRDITERKQAEAEIRELNESLERKIAERTSELKEANQGLESFSYSVSHDLRTPLRVISGYSGLLAKKYGDSLDPEAQDFIRSIRENAVQMSHLIDDLLNLSRIGTQDLVKTEVDMHQVILEAITELSEEEEKDILPLFTIKKIESTHADAGLIRQVWLNLISNAVKYSSRKDNPQIEIGSSEKKDVITYYIKDNGAGFDMAHADKLFGAFQRLHDKGEFEGTGVGLAIVYQIITKHGGRIWAESALDQGATFFFTLG